MAINFELQFNPSETGALAKDYDYPDDTKAIEAGKGIAKGDDIIANFKIIVAWKSPRSKGRASRNTEADVADALRLAVDAKTDRAAVAVLTGLRGVDVPVASAILAAIEPDRFTIIDRRALESLGVKQPSPTVEFYLEYLAHCRRLASEQGVSLRELDRALWQWSNARNPQI